jgi:anti-sigma B factor antagonist
VQLTLQSEILEYVTIVRCRGRIVSGDEVAALQLETEKLTHLKKRVVLDLAEVSFIDSAGLGALVRIFGTLRAEGGGLKLCSLSPFVLQVLRATSLLGVIPTYASEKEAIEAFLEGPAPVSKATPGSKTRVVCLHGSNDLLAYLKALLTRAGYEVFTTRNPSDAKTLVAATAPQLLIYGADIQANSSAFEAIRRTNPNVQILALPPDFSTVEASQAGTELLERLRVALADHK